MPDKINNYDLKASIQRLAWRFQKSENERTVKTIKPNESDFKALKIMVDWIDRQSQENVKNNSLFVKLALYFYTDSMRKYEATVFDSLLQKELMNLLDRPVEDFFRAFYDDLINRQFQTVNIRNLERGDKVNSFEDFEANYPYDVAVNEMNKVLSEIVNRLS